MTAVRRLISIVCLALAATAVFAQGAQPPARTPRETEPVAADTDRDSNDARAMQLSLDDAIRTSLKQNLGVSLQTYSYAESAQNLRGSYGIFDPFASAALSRSRREGATLSAFEASSSGNTSANLGFDQKIPTGGVYSINMNNQRFTRAGFGTTLSPGYSTSLGFAFTQPLARDFGVNVTRRNINIARNNLGISRELFRSVLMDTAHAVEQAYLDLIYARQYVDVVKQSLFLARDQSRITQIRIDVGASAPLDILQPRVQIATTEETLISAVASVRSAEDRLRALMNLPPGEWDRPIIPTEKVGYEPVSINVEEAVTRAFSLRPEVKENELATDIRRVQAVYAHNQVLPQFDVNVGYNLAGAAGRLLDPSSGRPEVGVEQTRYRNALSQVLSRDFPGWNVGVTIGVPVFAIGQRAEAKRADLEYDRSKTLEAQTRQNIAVEVRTYARAVDTAAKQITATRAARDAAEQNLDAERKRYENGMTTNFQVLQVQQQLNDARVSELNALVGYNKAVAAYHRAVGDLLETRNITVEEPELVAEPRMFTRFDRYNWLNSAETVQSEVKQ